jgi:hypothetical protein
MSEGEKCVSVERIGEAEDIEGEGGATGDV